MTYAFAIATQLLINGAWTVATDDTYRRDPITISRGRSDEASTVDPSRCNLTLDNRLGRYSPRNPTGVYFGKLGRNTQLRVLTDGTADRYLALAGTLSSCAATPDAASLDITGDIDIRMEIEPFSWRPGTTYGLARKYVKTSEQRSWSWSITDGLMQFAWSVDGTSAGSNLVIKTAGTAIPSNSTRLAIRVVLDVNNGAAGNDVKFYTAPSISGTWTQLGATVTTAGTTSIFASTAPLEVGRIGPDGFDPFGYRGKMYAFELRNGIAGAVVASPFFATVDTGITSLTDPQGNVWALTGNAIMVNPNARFHGEVSSWPPRWGKDGKDVYTPVQADGILRRLGQGASALKSTLRRGLTTQDNVVAYWPMEDGADSTELASGLPGHPSMNINPTAGTAVRLATYGGFKASEALPEGSGAILGANVPDYPLTVPTVVQVRFLMHIPTGGLAAESIVARVFTSGTAARWDLSVTPSGGLRLVTYDGDGTQINDSGGVVFGVNGKNLRVSIELERIGTAVTYRMVTLEVGQSTGSTFSGSVAGQTLGKAVRVVINPGRTDAVAFGHVSVHDSITSIFDLGSELNAYTGETAPDRIMRLCADEGIPAALVGSTDYAATLGPQLPATLLDLLNEAAATDLGILYEPREFFGLAYRTRASLYAQDAALGVDYGDLLSIEPTEDDQATRNDITVGRPAGASAREELTTGALSTLPPPNGVGRYDESITISTDLDTDLANQAGWRLHLGTVDEARYPVIGLDLAGPTFVASAPLTADALALDIGDKITVANPPGWLPPDDISQMVQGLTETLIKAGHDPFEYHWLVDVNCSPASPWDVGIWDAASGPGEARYESNGTTLAASVTSTATIFTVATPSGPLWTAVDGAFDIYVAGERMTLSAVSGLSSPQTFYVTRSVNGVVKAHSAGEEVRLFKSAVYAL